MAVAWYSLPACFICTRCSPEKEEKEKTRAKNVMSEKETMQGRREMTGPKLDDQSFTSPAARSLPVKEPGPTAGSKLKDQSFSSPAACGLPVHDPEFRGRWPFFSPPPSVNFLSRTRRVCADEEENLRQTKRQNPGIGGTEPELTSAAVLLNDSSSELACSSPISMGLTEMVDMPVENNSCVDVNSSCLVKVGEYQVRASSKPVLDRIFHKHGDITATFVMLAPESRSVVLDKVCEIIQLFETNTFKGVIPCELQRVVDRVRDFERAGLKIGWLLERLQGILEAYQLLQQAPALKEERDVNSEVVEAMKREQQELEQKLVLVNQGLKAAEAKLGRTKENILKAREIVKSYIRSPLVDKLL